MLKRFHLSSAYLLIGIIILASILRLVLLDKIPTTISGDELIYVQTAKAVLLTGKDSTGTWTPLSILAFHYPPSQHQAELSYLLLIFWMGMFGSSIYAIHVLFALQSIALVFVMYLLASAFWDKRTGLIASFIAAINPWFIFIGRTSYEVLPATVCFAIGLFIIIKQKGKVLLLSIPFFFSGFYAYIGTKIIFLPFIYLSLWYSYRFINKRKYGKIYIAIATFCTLLVIFYALMLFRNPASTRLSEIFTPSDPTVIQEVNRNRHESIKTSLLLLYENRYSYYLLALIAKTFTVFSPMYLFFTGDYFYGLWHQGLFYIVSAFFAVIGFIAVWIGNRKLCIFLIIMTFLSVLPHVFHGGQADLFTPHIGLLFIFFILIIAAGINAVSQKRHVFVTCGIIAVYFLSLFHFVTVYFFEFPIQGTADFPVRILSRYLLLSEKKGLRAVVYSNNSQSLFSKYIFYENLYDRNTAETIKNAFTKKTETDRLALGNVLFTSCNPDVSPASDTKVLIYDTSCAALKRKIPHVSIPMLSDGGEVYAVYNDFLCNSIPHDAYPKDITFTDLGVENLTPDMFCSRFITKPY